MAEAEEVIADVARHATVYARALWRRHRKATPGPPAVALREAAQRLDLLVSAVFGRSFPLRPCEAPAPATLLTKVFRRSEGPRVEAALPATDGASIWLPATLPDRPGMTGLELFRVLALQQAMRAERASTLAWQRLHDPLERAVYHVLEAQAADAALARLLPGTRQALQALRSLALRQRPSLRVFPAHRVPVERLVRAVLASDLPGDDGITAVECAERAKALAEPLRCEMRAAPKGRLLFRDLWTGEMREPSPACPARAWQADATRHGDDPERQRSARLARRPKVRKSAEEEDDTKPGAWMVQTSQPHEQAEDPLGLQRQTDRAEDIAAEDLADSLSELPEARLVSTPGRAKEVLLSDDPPDAAARQARATGAPGSPEAGSALRYPEWDYRAQAYDPGRVTVHVRMASEGPQQWVDQTLEAHRSTANLVRRRFEMLKARRLTLRRQLDGDDVDLQAFIDACSDFRAGLPMPQTLYQAQRQARKDLAILLLVDVSGSTDGWISARKRVIDVEREALLLVSIALQGMAEPNAILAFSGEGPRGVVVRVVKAFDEAVSALTARRIAALEPEHYTRAGAAIRHATAVLMKQPQQHRLLLVLSDGKPNDIDEYEGRYGVEDMRQAVTEARLQGVRPFCLTVDRQAAGYLPGVFGAHQYALLPRPELLPTVLLNWMRRLVHL